MQTPDLRLVDVDTLTVDPRVQRSLDPRRTAKIVAEFRPDALGVITVSARPDGTHTVIDGQHRVEAMRQAGHVKVMARVFTGLGEADEATMFRLLNNTAKPQYIDLFRIRIIEGEPNAAAIADMLTGHGWRIGIGTSDGLFSAVAAIERIHRTEPTAASNAIDAVTKAWGYGAAGADHRIVEGLGLFFIRYGAGVNRADLIRRLAGFPGGPTALVGKARGLKEMLGVTAPRAVAEILVELYNSRRRANTLAPWRS